MDTCIYTIHKLSQVHNHLSFITQLRLSKPKFFFFFFFCFRIFPLVFPMPLSAFRLCGQCGLRKTFQSKVYHKIHVFKKKLNWKGSMSFLLKKTQPSVERKLANSNGSNGSNNDTSTSSEDPIAVSAIASSKRSMDTTPSGYIDVRSTFLL
jgi:hypothetical protein